MRILQLAALAALSSFVASPADADTPLERGSYLMNGIVACGNCHTTLGPDGQPVDGMELAGQLLQDIAPFTAYAPNITPDTETGIGDWTDEQIITAIREGKRPDGSIIGPPMPIGSLSRALRHRRQGDRRLSPPGSGRQQRGAEVDLPHSTARELRTSGRIGRRPCHPATTADYGAYLAGPAGHCIECHTPMGDGHPDFDSQLGAGGFELEGPWGISVSANLTPHPTDGIAGVSDDDLRQMITTGIRPDGSKMLPPMGYRYYANIRP